MVSPERPDITTLQAEIKNLADQLEKVDENENTIERENKLEKLLELYTTLDDEIASSEIS